MPRVRAENFDLDELDPFKNREFKPKVKSARTIIDAISFLQKTGFATTMENIKTCLLQRNKKTADKIMETLDDYLIRGLELGILEKGRGNYKIGKLANSNVIADRKPRTRMPTKRRLKIQRRKTMRNVAIKKATRGRATRRPKNI